MISWQRSILTCWNQFLDLSTDLWWFWYLSMGYLLIVYMEISDILCIIDWSIACSWGNFSFSNFRMKTFSVGQMSATDHSSWDIFFSIYLPFLLFVEVPNFLNLWDHKVGSSSELWYQSSLCFHVMNSFLYSFWGILYYSHIPCVFSEFLYADDCIVFKEN